MPAPRWPSPAWQAGGRLECRAPPGSGGPGRGRNSGIGLGLQQPGRVLVFATIRLKPRPRHALVLPIALGALALGAAPALAIEPSVSPEPGTPDASPLSQISFRGVPARQLGPISVTGSRTGRHSGHLEGYASRPGASFLVNGSFRAHETVTVRLARKGRVGPLRWSFRVAHLVGASTPPHQAGGGLTTQGVQVFQSRPDLRPPYFATAGGGGPLGPGQVFVAAIRGPGSPMYGQFGPSIIDNNGSTVWFRPARPGDEAFDFHPQTLFGKPVLTWWEGHLSPIGFGEGDWVIANDAYQEVGRIRDGNGLRPDLHDMVITPQGSAFVTVYETLAANLRHFRGPSRGSILDSLVQEVDIKTGLVMWEWHSLGHVAVADSMLSPDPKGATFDAFHTNSIDLSPDGGTVLIGMRNTWAGYLVNVADGAITWRLGGRHSTFALGKGAGFAYQHDMRLINPRLVRMFDNEATPKVGPRSRGLTVRLNFSRHQGTLVRELRHTGTVLSGSQGNVESLTNGNTFVGWGAPPLATEFSRTGKGIFDLRFPGADESYRSYRFVWAGHPKTIPDVVAKRVKGRLTAYVSWNGATEVAAWQVVAGASATALAPTGRPVLRSGFETAIPVSTSGHFLAVRAYAADGALLATSKVVKV